MRYILFFLLFISFSTQAAIYIAKDQDGNVTYSDTPTENSHLLNASEESDSSSIQISPTLNTADANSNAKATDSAESPASSEQPIATPYVAFSIQSPKDQENIQNQPNLIVDVNVEPKLVNGDKIQILLDGKLMGNSSADTHIVLGQPERGTHVLSAIIIDKNNKVLMKSNPITIYVNRVNVNFKPGQNSSLAPVNSRSNQGIISRFRQLFS